RLGALGLPQVSERLAPATPRATPEEPPCTTTTGPGRRRPPPAHRRGRRTAPTRPPAEEPGAGAGGVGRPPPASTLRRGPRAPRRLCVQPFDRVLASPGVPGGLRAAVWACGGLCLAGQPVFVGHHPLVLAHGLVDERPLLSEESQSPSGHSRSGCLGGCCA